MRTCWHTHARQGKAVHRTAWQVVEARTRFGSFLGSHLVAMLVALSLAASGVLPTAHTSYEVVWSFIMPLAASCFLLETDVARCACMLARARLPARCAREAGATHMPWT